MYKIKKAKSLLLHCSDGIWFTSVMIADTSLEFVKAGFRESSKYVFHNVPFYNNTLIVSKEEHVECIYKGVHELYSEN